MLQQDLEKIRAAAMQHFLEESNTNPQRADATYKLVV
jgi:hypothetical protein